MSKIIFVGHSIVKGTDYGGVTTTDTFAYKIGVSAGYAPADIVIKGVSSEKSAALLARLQADVPAGVYDVCVVMTGANDWSGGVSIADFTSNMRAIATYMSSIGTKLVLMTDNMNRGTVSDFVSMGSYENVTRKIAVEFNAPLVDVFSRMCVNAMCNDYVKYYASTSEPIHLGVLGNSWVSQVASETSPKNMFVKTVATTPPVTTPTESDVKDLCVAIADYLIDGQTSAGLAAVAQVRSQF